MNSQQDVFKLTQSYLYYRGNLKLHIGKSGKWRSYLQFEVLTADYVVKWIKRRIDSKSSPHFTIEVKSDTEVTFKVHKKVQFNQ